MTRLRPTFAKATAGFGGQVRFIMCAFLSASVLSACADVTDQVQYTLSGALAPVNEAVNEVSRRATEVGEGINEVTNGVQRVRGALSGSGSRW